MGQVSYSTITITDTTDLEEVFLIYKGSSSNTTAPSIVWSGNTNDWKTNINQVTGDYIWAITVFKYTGVVITSSNYTNYYSDPVCITGEPGTSISITSIRYSTATTQSQPDDNTFTLTSPPSVPDGGYLWSRVLFSNGQSVYSKSKQGEKGERGTSILKVSSVPSSNSGQYPFRMSLSTIKTEAKVSEVLVGDIIESGTNHYQVQYISGDNVYLGAVTSIKGDSGDTYYAFIKYATNSSGANMQDSPDSTHIYIGTYAGPLSNPSAGNYEWSLYTGTDGISVTGMKEIYYLKGPNDSVPDAPGDNVNTTSVSTSNGQWTRVIPVYIEDGIYYTSIQVTYSNGNIRSSDAVVNNAMTDANRNAYNAHQMAIASSESSAGALSIASGVRQNFFQWNNPYEVDSNFTLPAGSYTTQQKEVDFKANPLNGYLLTRDDGVWLGKGRYRMAALTESAFAFYRPEKHGLNENTDVGIAMKLTSSALEFYDNTEPPNVPDIIASFGATTTIGKTSDHHITLDSNGLKIYNSSGYLRAEYGSTINLYGNNGSNVGYPRTTIDSNNVTLYQASNHYIQLNSTGMQIYKGGTASSNIIASFGDTITIGKSATQHVTLNSNGIQLYNSSGVLRANIASTTVFYGTNTQLTISSGQIKIGKDESANPWTGNNDEYLSIGISSTDNATYINCSGSGGTSNIAKLRLNDYQDTSERADLVCSDIYCASVKTTYGYEQKYNNAYEDLIRLADSGSTVHIYAGTYSNQISTRALYINSNGTLGTTSSSRRWKTNIRYLTDNIMLHEKQRILQGIRNIPISIFNYKPGTIEDSPGWDNWADYLGLIAEDVANYLPEAADYNPNDKTLVDNWQERVIIPAILLLAQESMNRVEELEQEIKKLKGEE